jgi:hypothetical protein
MKDSPSENHRCKAVCRYCHNLGCCVCDHCCNLIECDCGPAKRLDRVGEFMASQEPVVYFFASHPEVDP